MYNTATTSRIPPGSDSTNWTARAEDKYPAEFRPWTGRPDAFAKLRGKIPSGYTKDILEYLSDISLMLYRKGQTFEHIPASDWSDKWNEAKVYRLGTDAIQPEDIAKKLGCSIRTVQNSLSEAWEIGATARRKVGKRYAYTLIYEKFADIVKQDEPKARRGPIGLPRTRQPGIDPKGISEIPQGYRYEPVSDQVGQYRFEYETVAGETTRIRVIPIGETEANRSAQESIQVDATFCANGCNLVDSIESKSESEAKTTFQPLMPTDPHEAQQLSEAIEALRVRTKQPLSYTTLTYLDYVQVTISAVGRRGPFSSDAIIRPSGPERCGTRVNMQPQQKGVMPTEPRYGIRDTVAASNLNPAHAAILAAIPENLTSRFGPPGTVLMGQIETNLRGAPPKLLTDKIESSWDKITSTGILRNFSDEVGRKWQTEQSGEVVPMPKRKKKSVFEEAAELSRQKYGFD